MNINPKLINFARYSLFWSWNIIFALLFIFVLGKEVTWPVLKDSFSGWVPFSYAIYSISLFLIPFCTIIIALLPRYRNDSVFLVKLFYAVEIPLFFLCLARLIIFNELMSATMQLVLVYLIAIAAYAISLFNGDRIASSENKHATKIAYLHLVAAAMGLLIAIYFALLCIFYVPPIAKYTLVEFFQFNWAHHLSSHPLELLLVVFTLFTATLFVALPIAITYYHTRHLINIWRQSSHWLTPQVKVGLSTLAIIGNIFLFIVVNQQHQQTIFKQYGETAQLDNAKKASFLKDADDIRASLLNAYLAEYRYPGNTEDNNLLQYMYHDAFGLSETGAAGEIQSVYNWLSSPFLYKGKTFQDKQKARKLYQALFDNDIERAERKAIQASLSSNWRREGIEAGIVDIDRERVLITEQALTIKEYTHSAQITLNETYVNQTYADQEILYYFSLPEHTVFTGLWLSDERDAPEKFTYQIAPRGAAQKVYKQQLAKRRDPALLEQVGPRQYRLRVFPIRAKTYLDRDNDHPEKRKLYMKLRFAQALAEDGKWHMPELLERRNVYWNKNSNLSINGNNMSRCHNWLPRTIDAKQAKPLGEAVFWQAPDMRIIKEVKNAEKLVLIPSRLAVLIDSSYSMVKHRDALDKQLASIQQYIKDGEISARFYCVEQRQREAILPVSNNRLAELEVHDFDDPQSLLQQCQFFGSTGNVASLASLQATNLAGFDAILLITDDGDYDRQEHSHWKINANKPIWLIHLDHAYPHAYDDRLLDAMQLSGGGATDRFATVSLSLLLFNKNGYKGVLSDSALWLFIKESEPFDSSYMDPALQAIAAQQYLLFRYQQKGNALADLDSLHRLAIQNSIVTPFSSMIVLVNDEQREELAKANQSADRFNRSIEQAGINRRAPSNPFSVSAVPEPQEWALLICLFIIFAGAYISKRRSEVR